MKDQYDEEQKSFISTSFKYKNSKISQGALRDSIHMLSMEEMFSDDSFIEYMTYPNLNKRCSKQSFFTAPMKAKTVILDYYDKTNYEVETIYLNNLFKNLQLLYTENCIHNESDIIFLFCYSAMSGFMNDFTNINRFNVNYLTAEDINIVSMPLYYASNSDLCQLLLKQCEVFKNDTLLTSITFSELENKWDDSLGMKFDQLSCPENTAVNFFLSS